MKALVRQCLQEGYTVIPELEAQKICAHYGIPTPPTMVAANREECVSMGRALGYPVVMKVLSRQIIHKSDVGGVAVGISNDEQMGAAFDKMAAAVSVACPEAHIDGYVIQKMMPAGVEVVVGALRNEQFGPVVMFGMGGIYIEVFKDVEFRLAPLSLAEARRQVEGTKVYRILQGVRGQKPCDIDALCALIVNTGNLICEIPEIREIDFNPVLGHTSGCCAVDARIVIGG